MWAKCLPRYTIQPIESSLRNSNEIICKHRKLPLQVPGKVFRESGRSVTAVDSSPAGAKFENYIWIYLQNCMFIGTALCK